jgi:hypothetical protein
MRQLVQPAPPTTKLRATTTPLEVDAKDFGSFSENRLYQLIREQHNVLSRPTSSRFSRVRVVSDASFRRMTLPTLEPFRSTFGDCGCETRAGHRSYGSDSDRNTLEISGSLQSFSARCNHYSSLFGFCEFMDFPSIGTIETGASPSTHCGWAKPSTNRLYFVRTNSGWVRCR